MENNKQNTSATTYTFYFCQFKVSSILTYCIYWCKIIYYTFRPTQRASPELSSTCRWSLESCWRTMLDLTAKTRSILWTDRWTTWLIHPSDPVSWLRSTIKFNSAPGVFRDHGLAVLDRTGPGLPASQNGSSSEMVLDWTRLPHACLPPGFHPASAESGHSTGENVLQVQVLGAWRML